METVDPLSIDLERVVIRPLFMILNDSLVVFPENHLINDNGEEGGGLDDETFIGMESIHPQFYSGILTLL